VQFWKAISKARFKQKRVQIMHVKKEDLSTLQLPYDEKGLLPLIVQDAFSGRVLMLGYVNAEALSVTLSLEKVTFFSRSKGRLWTKGESSGHFLQLQSLWLDCDQDTLLALVKPSGPTCHRGTQTCFDTASAFPSPQLAILADLEETLTKRATSGQNDPQSYAQKLFEAPLDRVVRKLFEEFGEWVCAVKNREHLKSNQNLAELCGETCDIVFHMMVIMRKTGLTLEQCLSELRLRQGNRRELDGTTSKV
jgi:phosphoribosyl-AMP cyclohydrolase / phosphoribosyl-ATP pyrophosphohydrolase